MRQLLAPKPLKSLARRQFCAGPPLRLKLLLAGTMKDRGKVAVSGA
jgi:hypothetical protein